MTNSTIKASDRFKVFSFNPPTLFAITQAVDQIAYHMKLAKNIVICDANGNGNAWDVALWYLVELGTSMEHAVRFLERLNAGAQIDPAVKEALHAIGTSDSPLPEASRTRLGRRRKALMSPSEDEEVDPLSPEDTVETRAVALKGDLEGRVERRVAEECMQTLTTIFNNIINSPHTEKFRKLELSNEKFQTRVGQHREGMKLLLLAGFVVDRETKTVFLPVTSALERLRLVRRCLC
eukprot:GHVO01070202.1.p1 GENE.GHVO01070202.1~~GHVO01070202.1.p1  ORF type:complete len:274 (+),score=46.37 GHVO01070202.1:115-822(+)